MPRALCLMYHGLSANAAAPLGADPHYTIAATCFADHLDALTAAGAHLGSARDGLQQASSHAVWLGFDDGDASNYSQALPILQERGLRADFFVNPARVGTAGYCGWSELRAMAEAGMSIQSHGLTHTYFTHLDASHLREELRVSKAEIEQHLGQPVTLLAPPGGRAPSGLAATAQALGYSAVLGSAPGIARWPAAKNPTAILPRVAVTAGHLSPRVVQWFQRGQWALLPLQIRYQGLVLAKQLLGDGRYEKVRARLLGSAQ